MIAEKYFEILKTNNLKITPSRRAMLQFFLSTPRYHSPEEVWRSLRKELKTVGLPTVYRNLEKLSNVGVLTKIMRGDRQLYYGLCRSEGNRHHHHLVCLKCGRIGVLGDCQFEEQIELVEKKSQFKVKSHFLQVEGLCSKCK